MIQVFLKDDKVVISTFVDGNVEEDKLFNKKKEIRLGQDRIVISKTILDEGFFDLLPYTSVKEVLLVNLGTTPKDKVSFKLLCKDNQYFFAGEKNYLQLLNSMNKNPNNYTEEFLDEGRNRLIESVRPKIQLLKHNKRKKGISTCLTREKVNYLLSYSDEETEGAIELSSKYASGAEKLIQLCELYDLNKFYIIIGEFNNNISTPIDNYNSNTFSYIPTFVSNSLLGNESQLKEFDKSDNSEDKSIAIVIHGLGSSCINPINSYGNLLTYLNTRFKVFTFDYLTINQKISKSGRLLSNIIDELRSKYKKRKIYIFAHSMGGLVARTALVKEEAEISYLLMAGTPNRGSRKVNLGMLARNTFFYIFSYNVRQVIKFWDYYDLLMGRHNGLKSLGNKTNCISTLNKTDKGNEYRYYCMAGDKDWLATTDNVIHINGRELPSKNILIDEWSHAEYFEGDLEKSVGELLNRYEQTMLVGTV